MYYFIINPKSCSGRGIKVWLSVKKELELRNIPYTAFHTEYLSHAKEIAASISTRDDEEKTIIIIGGDGTVNEVINGIDDYSKVILGYIPSGSSNDLARSLKLPKKPKEALDYITGGNKPLYYDQGCITDCTTGNVRRFACSSGIGYDACVCYEALNSVVKRTLNKFKLGKLTYFIIAAKQILKKPRLNGTISIDGQAKKTYKNLFMVTNMIHRYEGGGLLVTPKADPSDQKISVCLVHGYNKLQIFFLLPTIILGLHTHLKGVETFDCDRIEIETDQDCYVHADGELACHCNHITVSCLPEQIRIIA